MRSPPPAGLCFQEQLSAYHVSVALPSAAEGKGTPSSDFPASLSDPFSRLQSGPEQCPGPVPIALPGLFARRVNNSSARRQNPGK